MNVVVCFANEIGLVFDGMCPYVERLTIVEILMYLISLSEL